MSFGLKAPSLTAKNHDKVLIERNLDLLAVLTTPSLYLKQHLEQTGTPKPEAAATGQSQSQWKLWLVSLL